MSEEIFFIIVLSIIVFTIVVLTVLRTIYTLIRRKQDEKATPGSSLTSSELERMLRAAVTEAVAPILDKVDALEQRLEERASEPRLLNAPPSIYEPEEEATPEPVSRTSRRSTTR